MMKNEAKNSDPQNNNAGQCQQQALSEAADLAGEKILYISANEKAGRRQLAWELRESEERYRQLVELSPDVIVVHCEGKIVFINKAAGELYGVKQPEDLLGRNILDFVHPDYRETVAGRVREMLLKQKRVPVKEERFIKLDGTVIDVEVSAAPLTFKGKPAIQVVVRDITERKQAETALRLSEERFSKAFNSSPGMMSINTLVEGHYIDINHSFLTTTGYERDEVIGRSPKELKLWVEVEDMQMALCMLLKHTEIRNMESRFRDKWGNIYVGLLSADLIDLNGKQCVLSTITNITGRKLLEEKLRESEDRYRQLVELSPDAVVVHCEGKIVYINKTGAKHYGLEKPEELMGQPIMDLIHPDFRATVEERVRLMVEKGETLPLTEIKLIHRNGSIIDVEVSAVPSTFARKPAVLAVIRDITKRKQMDKEMARLERLNLIGEMAASIGHEIRNPMTAVRGFLQMLHTKKECLLYKEYFDIMIRELDRANAIITEFLSLARSRPVYLKPQNLKAILQTLSPQIAADALNSNKFINEDLGDVPDLLLDEKEISQLILNLVRNGLEATTPGESIIIKTYTEDNEVILLVQDSGQGIEPAIVDKLGTPFFSTKDHSTGLGLAVCYSIASRHNAIIKIETGPEGTGIYVRFKNHWVE